MNYINAIGSGILGFIVTLLLIVKTLNKIAINETYDDLLVGLTILTSYGVGLAVFLIAL